MIFIVALAFIAPFAACEDNHEAECAADCSCACHPAPVFSTIEQASKLTMLNGGSIPCSIIFYLERLSVADVFRPPIAS